MTPPIRVLAFPDRHGNPYLDLFYDALKPYGIEVSFTDRVDHRLLSRAHDFDVIHLHWALHEIWRRRAGTSMRRRWGAIRDWWMLLRRLKQRGVRVVWTAHELSPPDDGTWLDTAGYAVCARAADLCICHSSLARRDLARQFGIQRRKTLTLPVGTYEKVLPPPGERAATRERFGLPNGARLLVCFGDLRPRKGVEVALRAAALLGSEYFLVVAGDVPSPSLRSWAEGLERTLSGPNVRFVRRRLEKQELADLLSAADCVLFPYLHIFGSSALSLSLASGRAVVASALPYFSEVLTLEPEAGVLCAPGDPRALARAIRDFFLEPVSERHAAAARLGARLAWPALVPPVARWLVTPARARAAVRCEKIAIG